MLLGGGRLSPRSNRGIRRVFRYLFNAVVDTPATFESVLAFIPFPLTKGKGERG
jgi:hypothetical protein